MATSLPPLEQPSLLGTAAASPKDFQRDAWLQKVWRRIRFFIEREINVKDYGAVGDGTTDDTAAIDGAISALPAGGTLYFPPGNYVTTGGHIISVNNVQIIGAGKATTIYAAHATNNIFTLAGSYIAMRDLTISFAATRTAGAYIELTGGTITLSDLLLWGYFTGININSRTVSVVDISQINFVGCVTGGVGLDVNAGVDLSIRSSLWQAASGTPVAGIRVTNVGDFVMSDLNIIGQGTDLLISPGTGAAVSSIYATNCFFDTAGSGMRIVPTGTGIVQRIIYTGCWFSSHTNSGAVVDGSGLAGGFINGVDFLNCHFFNNTLSGLIVASAVHVNCIGGVAAANGNNGIVFNDAGCTDFEVSGMSCGATSGGNTGYGINIANAAADRFRIVGNSFLSNTLGAINNASTGTNYHILENIPYTANSTSRAKNFVSDATPSLNWNLDGSGINTPITMATGTNYDLAAGSGMVVVTFVTGGETAIYICGGGVTALVAQTAATFVNGAPAAGKFGFQYNGAGQYRLTNNIGSTKTVKVCTLRTRETA